MRSRTLFSFVPVCVASLVGFAATLHARPALMPDGAGRTVPARESAELAALDTFKPVREYFKTPAGKEDLKMLGDMVDLAIEYGWDKAPKRIGDAKTVLDFYSSDPSSPERWREFGLLAADTLLDKYYHVPFPARKALLWGLTRMIDSAFEHAEELLDKSDERLMEEAIRKHSRRRPVMKAAPEFGCIELCFGKVVSYAPAPPYRSSTVSGRTTPTVHYGPATRPAPHYTPPRYTPPPVSTAPGTRPPSSTISGPTPLPDRPSTITSPSPPRTPGATVSPSPPPRVPSPSGDGHASAHAADSRDSGPDRAHNAGAKRNRTDRAAGPGALGQRSDRAFGLGAVSAAADCGAVPGTHRSRFRRQRRSRAGRHPPQSGADPFGNERRSRQSAARYPARPQFRLLVSG
ncbi:MAG: hypothetical protein M5U33_13780 [Pseudorhodoplanes sp.]|nr:hypothetical protein [Pseudorhodoplanes sp.]